MPGISAYTLPANYGSIVWTGLTNAVASGANLTCVTAAPGGGWSVAEQALNGDGYVQCVADALSSRSYFGIGVGALSILAADMDFSFLFYGSILYVREHDVTVHTNSWLAGDVLQIRIVGTVATYRKNGVVIWTSVQTPAFPQRLRARIADVGSKVTGAYRSGLPPVDYGAPHGSVTRVLP